MPIKVPHVVRLEGWYHVQMTDVTDRSLSRVNKELYPFTYAWLETALSASCSPPAYLNTKIYKPESRTNGLVSRHVWRECLQIMLESSGFWGATYRNDAKWLMLFEHRLWWEPLDNAELDAAAKKHLASFDDSR